MQQLVELFPDSFLFATEPLEASGIYDRELPHGHRWLQRRTKLLVRPIAGHGRGAEWLRLTLAGPTWIAAAWIVVRIDGAFSGVAEIRGYGDHYFRVVGTATSAEATGAISVEIEVLTDCSGSPDPRDLAIALYGGGLVGDGEDSRTEAMVLRDQLNVVTGETPFAQLLESRSQKERTVALEIGGGMGVLSGLVAALTSAEVWCIDMADYNAADGESPRSRLRGIIQRNGRLIANQLKLPLARLDGIEKQVVFHSCDAEQLPLKDDLVDLVFSLNAFEHIRDPAKALAEVRRVLKPGGVAFVQFSPVYMADAGSHLWDQGLLNVPWCVLLHSREEIRDLVTQQGAQTHRIDEILDSLNGLPTRYYREMFAACDMQVEMLEEIEGCAIPGATESEQYVRAAAKFPKEDLLVLGFQALLRKRA